EPRETPQWIVDSIGAEAFERLTKGLGGSELQSLLLELMHARSHARVPAEVRDQYARDGFVRPAVVDQRIAVELDGHLLAAAESLEALELSPVAPLGTCTSLAVTEQHRILSALRGTAVVSDPTHVLELERAAPLSTGA